MLDRLRLRSHGSLALFLAVLVGACAGGAPKPAAPASPAPSASASAAPAPVGTPAAPPGAETSAPTANVAIVPSAMLADVKAIGIDLQKPVDLSKLDLSKKRKLMPFFVKALGMKGCVGCHVEGDYKAPTHNKEMAAAMWTHFVRDLRAKGGGALFCDSCHQGKQKLLLRADKKVLSTFMRENYEEKLERANKKEHSCETCHSDPFEGKIFTTLWKIGPG